MVGFSLSSGVWIWRELGLLENRERRHWQDRANIRRKHYRKSYVCVFQTSFYERCCVFISCRGLTLSQVCGSLISGDLWKCIFRKRPLFQKTPPTKTRLRCSAIWGWPSPMAGGNLGGNNPPTGVPGRARMNQLMTYEFSDSKVQGSSCKSRTLRGKVHLVT